MEGLMKNSLLAAIAFAALAGGAIGCTGSPCDEVASYTENGMRDAFEQLNRHCSSARIRKQSRRLQ